MSAQLGVLADFLGRLELGAAEPASCNGAADWCRGIPAWGSPVSDCGREANVYWATLRSAKISALYIHHSLPRSRIGGGRFDGYKAVACWSLNWIDPKSGKTLAHRAYSISDAGKTYASADKPFYAHDVLIVLSACDPHPLAP